MEELKDGNNTSNTQEQKEEEITMEELLGAEQKVEQGKKIKVRVVGASPEGVLVDLGMKSEGVILKQEFDSPEKMAELVPGTEVTVFPERTRSESGHPVVSYRRIREMDAWETIRESHKSGAVVEGVVRRKIKGGFIVDIGIDAFLPASQLDIKRVKDENKFIAQKCMFIVTEFNQGKKNVVVSRRKIQEKEQQETRAKVMETLEEGQILDGIVSGITEFGAFVDLGGFEGLLHVSDIAWHHVKKVGDVLKAGQRVRIKVMKIDKEKGKVSLGMKQLVARPWDSAGEKYKIGDVIKGKITSRTDFGIFVELEPGLEGLVHISEISWDEKGESAIKKYSKGQEIEAKITGIDKEKEKLSLSIKRLKSNPWEEAKNHYPAGTKVKGVVTHLTPFGAFVKLAEGIEGLIHVADMSWTKKVRHPQDVVNENQEVEVIVLDVNTATEKISLSLKHMSEDPFKKYKSGKAVTGTVKRIVDFGAFVELEPGVEALLRGSEISREKVDNPTSQLKAGQVIEAKIIKSDVVEKKIDISIRRLDQDREKELLKRYSNKESIPSLGDVLGEHTDEE
ncbi:MAG: 30S ribosomal protein S1 [Elusimicrobiota bacterium]